MENGESQRKCSSMVFMEVDIGYLITPLRNVVHRELDLYFSDKISVNHTIFHIWKNGES